MSMFGAVKQATLKPLMTPPPAKTPPARHPENAWPTDTVELRGVDRPAVGDARVAEIRRQIAAGTYLTDDKLDAVVDRLHTLLSSERRTRYEVA